MWRCSATTDGACCAAFVAAYDGIGEATAAIAEMTDRAERTWWRATLVDDLPLE